MHEAEQTLGKLGERVKEIAEFCEQSAVASNSTQRSDPVGASNDPSDSERPDNLPKVESNHFRVRKCNGSPEARDGQVA